MISYKSLDKNPIGKPDAGNPHVRFEVALAGNTTSMLVNKLHNKLVHQPPTL